MASNEGVTLLWHGAAHYHIIYNNTRIVIDPLCTRLPGDTPHLPVTRDDIEKIDCLLLTHGHLDHSKDFPYLVAKHNPLTFAPRKFADRMPISARKQVADCDGSDGDRPSLSVAKSRVSRDRFGTIPKARKAKDQLWDTFTVPKAIGSKIMSVPKISKSLTPQDSFDRGKFHALEEAKGRPFSVSDISITPYQIGTEEIDFWFIREMFIRPWKHRMPAALTAGFKWLAHHPFGNCFTFLFSYPPDGKTMLYFGNLTSQVDELSSVERVDVLAIPFCPANNHWLRDTQFLINRFQPGVALIHHFDNFMNPFTLYRYMNLDDYRSAVRQMCPQARLFFSKFYKEVRLSEIGTEGGAS